MIIGVRVLPRNEVLDTEGRAVAHTLKAHGYDLNLCRVGRYIQLEIPENEKAKALEKAKQIAEFVLYNPLIETYELEVVNS